MCYGSRHVRWGINGRYDGIRLVCRNTWFVRSTLDVANSCIIVRHMIACRTSLLSIWTLFSLCRDSPFPRIPYSILISFWRNKPQHLGEHRIHGTPPWYFVVDTLWQWQIIFRAGLFGWALRDVFSDRSVSWRNSSAISITSLGIQSSKTIPSRSLSRYAALIFSEAIGTLMMAGTRDASLLSSITSLTGLERCIFWRIITSIARFVYSVAHFELSKLFVFSLHTVSMYVRWTGGLMSSGRIIKEGGKFSKKTTKNPSFFIYSVNFQIKVYWWM